MGQKVNPKGYRLHLFSKSPSKSIEKAWQPTLFEGFTNKSTLRKKIFYSSQLSSFLIFFISKQKNAHIHDIFIKESSFGITVHVYVTNFKYDPLFFDIFKKHFELVFTNQKPLFFIFHKNVNFLSDNNSNNSNNLNHLLFETKSRFVSKAICYYIVNMLENSNKHLHVFDFCTKTFETFFFSKCSHLKGIQFQVKGRFNGSDRSKKMKSTFGVISTQSLNTYIDFFKSNAYTPYGVLGFKIWLAYK